MCFAKLDPDPQTQLYPDQGKEQSGWPLKTENYSITKPNHPTLLQQTKPNTHILKLANTVKSMAKQSCNFSIAKSNLTDLSEAVGEAVFVRSNCPCIWLAATGKNASSSSESSVSISDSRPASS
jgi:hypothetical protein